MRFLFLALALWSCTDAHAEPNLWPEHRGDFVGIPSSGATGLVQSFTAGAGSYTWNKPSQCNFLYIIGHMPGGGGGSGGYDTSDGGGGGGEHGNLVYAYIPCSLVNNTETVVLGAGAPGGSSVSAAGNGNPGGTPSETSFASVLFRYRAPSTISGAGGTAASASGGTNPGIGSLTAKVFSGFFNPNILNGGGGRDTVSGTSGSSEISMWENGILAYHAGSGGGGGGINGGANFTTGGAGGNLTTGTTITPVSQTQTSPNTGGSSDGAGGQNGSPGGFYVAGSFSPMLLAGGNGGGGGAGAVVANASGGKGGQGGNCGGGGGGGGSAKAGVGNHSGAGGDGGDACLYIFTY